LPRSDAGHVFSLSLRDVKLILTELGIIVTHESIRQWCPRFETGFARETHRRRPRSSDNWHLDEVFQRINDMLHYLWRAVEQHGVVLTSWCRTGGMQRLPSASSSACLLGCDTSRDTS
jgi:transposase-like protein